MTNPAVRGPWADCSSSTESSVTKVGLHLTDEKRTSVSQMESSWEGIGNEAAVVSQVAGSVPRRRLVEKGSDLEVDELLKWKPVQLAEHWRDAVESPSASVHVLDENAQS